MALVKTLLTAIVRTDGDALVMHVGEKPYVVTAAGNVELSSAGLSLEAMSGMLTQLLPADAMRSLAEFGAVEHHLQPPQGMRDAFTAVAARGGDDIWIEIRRKRAVVPTEVHPAAATHVTVAVGTFAARESETTRAPEVHVDDAPSASRDEVTVPEVPVEAAPELIREDDESRFVETAEESPPISQSTGDPERYEITVNESEGPEIATIIDDVPPPIATVPPEHRIAARAPVVPEHRVAPVDVAPKHGSAAAGPGAPRERGAPAVVVAMPRSVRMEVVARPASGLAIERLLELASASGASALYLTSQSRPLLRIDGGIRPVEGEPTLTSAHVDAAVSELLPDSARDAHDRGEPVDWVSDFDGVGRVRCSTFKDHRGAGALFQLISAKPMSAEQLGFAREIQELATESDGLVLVAGPQGGGKSTVIAGLVDLINRERSAYVITVERQIRIVHENHQALVSQREVRGAAAEMVSAARAAVRENPDVLVIEDVDAPDVIELGLEAAGGGVLVFLSVTAGSTVSALEHLVDAFPPDRREGVQALLAERLRGAVTQVLLRTKAGGRVAARELLLTTAAVASLIGDGHFAQLAVALESGRGHGMVSLNDALHHLLQSGVIDVREAYRKADDREALFALLKRDGVDTSFVERLLA